MTETFSYTNHTVLAEALEKWSVEMLSRVLPRHMEIIYLINHFFIEELKNKIGKDWSVISKTSLIQEGDHKQVLFANLAFIGCHRVNGVAKMHTECLKSGIFKEQSSLFPEKILNITNGVTPRRWIYCSNPKLAQLIDKLLMDNNSNWLANYD